ncbi:hypothetical protein JHK86_047992 [Glycine max]|nr:hypothetical protein JHK86_047992 [Glycine max]
MEIFEAVLRANLRFSTHVFCSISPTAKDLLRRMLCKELSRRFSIEQVLTFVSSSPSFSFHEQQTPTNTTQHDQFVGDDNSDSTDDDDA